ncbi:hypothetical protein H257_13621 [Aphanomyces astaci]|uniref:Methyltransferase domain-containing protein n=1 Tax=Aphanomyces astaci TaxID=112090 RepID=W4FTJ9_APHAT|nr:hypothetical protein H257_13621 [Aphanomyces astaci]ETV70840.1 hypothetical protein H257_13621 [Aphanomyces astaci]RQM24482.1 hypothetical protein B5M09_002971 [Aphanomyces astaci]|eukprot:XP_009839503.1 hypothetical protein H257_13621 [Aphanomyces astaci]
MLAPRKVLHSTPVGVIEQAFSLAQVNGSDVVCDVGCGDGRVLLYAASSLHVARCVGMEIDADRVCQINEAAKRLGVDDRVTIYCGNALDMDLDDDVTVIFLFLIERGLRQIFRKLLACTSKLRHKELRIVTYLYRVHVMDPYMVSSQFCPIDPPGTSDAAFPIYLYKLPPLTT